MNPAHFIPHIGGFPKDGTPPPERPAGVPAHYVWHYSAKGISGWRESPWKTNISAPPLVRRVAHLLQPKIGQAASQIGMGEDGVRYVFVFENPMINRPADFWWQALDPIPDDVRTSPAPKPDEWGGLGK